MASVYTQPRVSIVNCTFILGLLLITLIGVPLYIYNNGIGLADILLFTFWFFATGTGITAGYHRLFAHKTYKANGFYRAVAVFFGSAAFQQSALEWASQHRQHHGKVDTEDDPYNIRKGFWYAHITWLLFWKHHTDFTNVKDLQKYRLLRLQDKYYFLFAFFCGAVVPIAIGSLFTSVAAAALFSVAARVTAVYQATFSINSLCHWYGTPTFDPDSTAKDNWIVAFLTNGEGYHNFHHRFPNDYRNGVRWYHWDPSKWLIRGSSWLGMTWDLQTIPQASIDRAREHARMKVAGIPVPKPVPQPQPDLDLEPVA